MDKTQKWDERDVWPLSIEFTMVLALATFPWLFFIIGWQMALESVR